VPIARLPGCQLEYAAYGRGDPVLLIPPAGTRMAVWSRFQIPALIQAGFRVITVENRGSESGPSLMPSTDLGDYVGDCAAFITALDLAPCRLVGASLGAMVAQELTLAYPMLVRGAALLGTRSRTDMFRARLARAHAARMTAPSLPPPSELEILTQMAQIFSSETLSDDRKAADWYEVIKAFPLRGPGPAAQYLATIIEDRRTALHGIGRPCLVVGFSEDRLTPPAQCRETADAIPACLYAEIAGCGHFGFMERPDAVNEVLVSFLRLTC
jgi:pimeloyl-ACP methyl ester carboxylesterase